MESTTQPARTPLSDGDLVYRVNAHDEITYVNEEWERFAAENTPPGGVDVVAPSQVVGRPLWEFIVDDTTRQLYHTILQRVRQQSGLRFTFRCDGPDCRRLMEMEISAQENSGVEFRTRLLESTPRPPQTLLDVRAPRGQGVLRMCSWCNRMQVGGEWFEVDEAVSQGALFTRDALPALSHGICDDCYETMRRVVAPSTSPPTPPFRAAA